MLRAILGRAFRAAAAAWTLLAGLAAAAIGQGWAYAALAGALAWLTLAARAIMADLTAKTYNAHTRLDALTAAAATFLPKSGGTITGDLHIGGALYGAAGVLDIGDNVEVAAGKYLTAGGRLGTHSDFWCDGNVVSTDTTFTGTVHVNGNFTAGGTDTWIHGNLHGESGHLYIVDATHISGTLYGTASVLTIGDKAKFDAGWSVGGHTVTLSTAADGQLRCGALSQFTDTTNTAFLASLTKCGSQIFAGADDNNTGSTWVTGERGYINDAKHSIDAIHNSLRNNGFMA